MPDLPPEADAIEADLWRWIREFVVIKSDFYRGKFAPCPYAQSAVASKTVDVAAWRSGDFKAFIREQAMQMRCVPGLTTRVIGFPPRAQHAWGISQFVESLNAELIPHNIFLNTGTAKTTVSRYPGSNGQPYFIAIANSLEAVLKGAEALKTTDYYANWPPGHFELVVRRRERMAAHYGSARRDADL
jgi:hypothetical protein